MYQPNLHDNEVDYQRHLPPYNFDQEQFGIKDGIIIGVNESIIEHRRLYPPPSPMIIKWNRFEDCWKWLYVLDFYVPILIGVYYG